MNMIMNLSLKQNYAVDVLFKNWIAATLKFNSSENFTTICGLIITGFNSLYYWGLCYMQNYHKIMFLDKIKF